MKIKVAATQMSCSWEIEENILKAKNLIQKAADKGANIILLQELFQTPYFCIQYDEEIFKLAQTFENNKILEEMSNLAKKLKVVLPISFFEKSNNAYFNSIAVINSDGKILGKYRKSHIPDGPGYLEKYYFNPGNTGFKVWNTNFGKIGIGICWDQWFPEAARIMALKGAEILFYPTAIGWHPKEKKKFGKSQLNAWLSIQRSHAIANGVYVAAVNRVGVEKLGSKKLEFWGNTVVFDPGGNVVASSKQKEKTLICDIDYKKVETARRHWPFFRDRRIDYYKGILNNPRDA